MIDVKALADGRDQSQIARIADGLTEAMKADLGHPDNSVFFWSNDGRTAKALQRKGLIGTLDHAWRAEWTPLGLAVRAELARRQETPDAE